MVDVPPSSSKAGDRLIRQLYWSVQCGWLFPLWCDVIEDLLRRRWKIDCLWRAAHVNDPPVLLVGPVAPLPVHLISKVDAALWVSDSGHCL